MRQSERTPRHLQRIALAAVLGGGAMLACGRGVNVSGDGSTGPGGTGGGTMATGGAGPSSGGAGPASGGTGGRATGGGGGTPSGGSGGRPTGGAGGTPTGGTGGRPTGGSGGTATGGGPATGGSGGTPTGGTGTGGATPTGGASGNVIFFDDFQGSTIDAAKWSVVERISDQANNELNCCLASNVSVSGGFLVGASKFEDHTCGDSILPPRLMHYTSWHIQQKTAPFLYGTVEVRAKEPGGTGVWPTIWMLGYKWQASQPFTANTPEHNWPHDGWCETDIAEFLANHRMQVNNNVHFNVPGGTHENSLPFDATTRFMVYRLQWSKDLMIWSVNAEDGAGYRMLRTVTGAGNVPDVAQYVVINAAIGGLGGGTPNPTTFPQTFTVDWVRVTQ